MVQSRGSHVPVHSDPTGGDGNGDLRKTTFTNTVQVFSDHTHRTPVFASPLIAHMLLGVVNILVNLHGGVVIISDDQISGSRSRREMMHH
jgi:hypothetical protein